MISSQDIGRALFSVEPMPQGALGVPGCPEGCLWVRDEVEEPALRGYHISEMVGIAVINRADIHISHLPPPFCLWMEDEQPVLEQP